MRYIKQGLEHNDESLRFSPILLIFWDFSSKKLCKPDLPKEKKKKKLLVYDIVIFETVLSIFFKNLATVLLFLVITFKTKTQIKYCH